MLIPFFLCWGSFLNVIAYRLMHPTFSFFDQQSRCPDCTYPIAWYDNIPVISWILLQAKCRHCQKPISYLYPFIELLTALSFLILAIRITPHYLPAYFVFFTALIITIRTDLETMFISRFVSLWLIPVGICFSYFGFLPISLYESLIGCISGYLVLFAVTQFYYILTNKVGMGQGDIELLAFIGSFTGIFGWWITLLIASCLGTLIGLIITIVQKKSFAKIKIPFGPFLACGAIIFVLFKNSLIKLIFAF